MRTRIDDRRVHGSFALMAALLGVGCGAAGDHGDGGGAAEGGTVVDARTGGRDVPILRATDASGGMGGGTGNADGGGCAANLTGRLRDFVNKPGFTPAAALDDDFENALGDDRGIVATDLGSDKKPVYAHPGGMTPTTHGQTQFDWWYRDTSGKNLAFDYTITLTPSAGGLQTFNNQEFFPLDGRGWNDEYVADDGMLHNFSFTFELHTTFGYAGGEAFTFTGDDDVFVFINNKLVVDLGGVHGAETKAITLGQLTTDDAAMSAVPLVVGMTYPLDIFYNERHTVSSHFRMDTSIAFNNCMPIIVPQ